MGTMEQSTRTSTYSCFGICDERDLWHYFSGKWSQKTIDICMDPQMHTYIINWLFINHLPIFFFQDMTIDTLPLCQVGLPHTQNRHAFILTLYHALMHRKMLFRQQSLWFYRHIWLPTQLSSFRNRI